MIASGAALAGLVLAASPAAAAPPPPVNLGATLTTFAVLAGTTVTNTGPTVVSGDLGVSPGSAVTGFPPGTVTNGAIHAADVTAAQAQLDLTAAYINAAGRPPGTPIVADLGGLTLLPGVYTTAIGIGITGTLTLDAQGDPNAVFVLQAGSTLVTASESTINLVNGAQACKVFWKVGSSATLGTNSSFAGNVLALTSITATTGVSVAGRLLARNGAVTMDTNAVTRPTVCLDRKIPSGNPATGGGGASHVTDAGLLTAGGIALAGAFVAAGVAWRRRSAFAGILGTESE